jgi:hypothetical protein
MLSDSKLNRKLYGKLLDHPLNLQKLCVFHHLSAPVDKLSEVEFCELLNIVPRSKTALEIYRRKNGKDN